MIRELPNYKIADGVTELFPQLGWDPYEGVNAAFIPDIPNDAPNEEHMVIDGVACVYNGMVIDVVNVKPTKWWKVRNAARELGLSFPEPIWSGPVSEFSVNSLPDVPQPEGTILAVRRFHQGPWIKLQEKIEDESPRGVVSEASGVGQEEVSLPDGAPNPTGGDATPG
jgi:hypothetical protein